MKAFINKVIGFSIGPFASALLGIILIPLLTRFISPEEYGKASMFTVAQGLLSTIIYLGMDQAYAREQASTKNSKDSLLLNAMAFPMILALISGIALIIARKWVGFQLFGSHEEWFAVLLTAAMLPFMVVQHFSLAKLRFEEKGFQYSIFSVLLKVWTLIFSVVLLVGYERSFRSVVYGAALSEIVNGSVLFFVCLRNVKFSLKDIHWQEIKGLLKFSLPLVPACIIGWILTSMDKVMLRSLCTYEELGLYSAAAKIVSALGVIQTCFTSIWIPIAFRWYSEGKKVEQFSLVMKWVAALMSCICFCLLACKDIVGWVLGESFVQAISVFPFLTLQPIMYTMSETTTLGISFSRKTGYNIVISIFSGLVNLVLNYFLIPIWGGVGAAIATGFSYIVFFWLRTLFARMVWKKFTVWYFLPYTVLILLNCAAHTFLSGIVVYAVSMISVAVVIVANIPLVKYTMAQQKTKDNQNSAG